MDVILSGFLPPPTLTHSPPLLAQLARLLQPSGSLFLREPVTTSGERERDTHSYHHKYNVSLAKGTTVGNARSPKKLVSSLKLSGFVDVSEVYTVTVCHRAFYIIWSYNSTVLGGGE